MNKLKRTVLYLSGQTDMRLTSGNFLVFLLLIFSGSTTAQRIFQIRGTLMESDTNVGVPFAYVINLNSQNGVITDPQGRFVIAAGENDSIQFNCVGFESEVVKVSSIPNETDSEKVVKRYRLKRKVYELGSVYVNRFKIKPNERDYMQRVINRPKVQGINVMESPITAIWQAFSRKGREMQKLEAIFTDLLRKEEIEKKVNTTILRKLLNDENITFDQFRIMCPDITDEFILASNGYELYSAISTAYKKKKRRK